MKAAIRGRYRIINNKNIARDVFELCIDAPDIVRAAKPGQFVNVYIPDGGMLLPRPISIAFARGGTLTLVYAAAGKGTGLLAGLREGESLEIMGPLGNGFFGFADNEDRPGRILLIGGGAGIPPLYFAAGMLKKAKNEDIEIVAALGFRDCPWYVDEFSSVCGMVGIATESAADNYVHGNVIDLLNSMYPGYSGADGCRQAAALALACGPRPMLKAVSEWCAAGNIPLRVSLEERMGCGYGACAGCSVKLAGDSVVRQKVCADGPVFRANEVVW